MTTAKRTGRIGWVVTLDYAAMGLRQYPCRTRADAEWTARMYATSTHPDGVGLRRVAIAELRRSPHGEQTLHEVSVLRDDDAGPDGQDTL